MLTNWPDPLKTIGKPGDTATPTVKPSNLWPDPQKLIGQPEAFKPEAAAAPVTDTPVSPFNPKNPANQEFNKQLDQRAPSTSIFKNFMSSLLPAAGQALGELSPTKIKENLGISKPKGPDLVFNLGPTSDEITKQNAQAAALKTQEEKLTQMKASLDMAKANGNSEAYNAGVDAFNNELTLYQENAKGFDANTQLLQEKQKSKDVVLGNAEQEMEYRKKLIRGDANPQVSDFLTTFETSTGAGKLLNLSNRSQADVKGMIADDYAQAYPAMSAVAKGLGTLVDVVMLNEAGAGFNIASKTKAAAGGLGDLFPVATRVIGRGLESGTVFGIQSFLSEALDQTQRQHLDVGQLAEQSGKGFAFGLATGGAGATSSYLRQIGYAGLGVAGLTTLEKYVQNGKITAKDLTDIGVNAGVAMVFQAFAGRGTAEKFQQEDLQALQFNKEVNDVVSRGMSPEDAPNFVKFMRSLAAIKMSGQDLSPEDIQNIIAQGMTGKYGYTFNNMPNNTELIKILNEIPESFKALPSSEQIKVVDAVTERVRLGEPLRQAIGEETSLLPNSQIKGNIPAPVSIGYDKTSQDLQTLSKTLTSQPLQQIASNASAIAARGDLTAYKSLMDRFNVIADSTPTHKDYKVANEAKQLQQAVTKGYQELQKASVAATQDQPGKSTIPAPKVSAAAQKEVIRTVIHPDWVKSDDLSAGIIEQLKNAEPGTRIFQGYGSDQTVSGVKSTFPDWIPEDLRKSAIVKPVAEHLANGTLPTAKKQIELYNYIADMIGAEEMAKQDEIAQVNAELDGKENDIEAINKLLSEAQADEAAFDAKLEQQNEQKGIRKEGQAQNPGEVSQATESQGGEQDQQQVNKTFINEANAKKELADLQAKGVEAKIVRHELGTGTYLYEVVENNASAENDNFKNLINYIGAEDNHGANNVREAGNHLYEKQYSLHKQKGGKPAADGQGRSLRGDNGKLGSEATAQGFVDIRGEKAKNLQQVGSLLKDFRNPEKEVFHVVYTNTVGKVLAHTAISSKGIDYVALGQKELAYGIGRRADRLKATKIYVAHNHPSGDPTPSQADVNMTFRLKQILGKRFFGQAVLDHSEMGLIKIDTHGGRYNSVDVTKAKVDLGISYQSIEDAITGPDQLVELARTYWKPTPGKLGIFITDTQLRPVAYKEVNFTPEKFGKINDTIKQAEKENNGNGIFLAGTRADLENYHTTTGEKLLANDFVVQEKGKKLRALADERYTYVDSSLKAKPFKQGQRLFEAPERPYNEYLHAPQQSLQAPVEELSRLAINSLQNKKAEMDTGAFERAKADIKKGKMPPVKIRENGKGHIHIESGQHHLAAAQALGLKKYPLQDVSEFYNSPEDVQYGFIPKNLEDPASPKAEFEAEKVVKRSDIAKYLSDKLNVPIRRGKFRGPAIGVYKGSPKVVRIKKGGLDTVFHEVGHYIDDNFNFSDSIENDEATALLVEYGKPPKPGSQKEKKEAFAEFLRYRMTGQEQKSLEFAPKFSKIFDDKIEQLPEIKEIIDTATADYSRWQMQPAVAKVLSHISFDDQDKKSISERVSSGLHNLYTLALDELHPLAEFSTLAKRNLGNIPAEQDPYILARNTRGWIGKANTFLTKGTFGKQYWKVDDNGKTVPNYTGKSFVDIMQPIERAGKLDDFKVYLVSQRVLELADREVPITTGISRQDAQDASDILITQNPEFAQAATDLYKYQDDLLVYAEGSGLIGSEGLKKIRELNKFRVPFYRVMQETSTVKFMGGRKIAGNLSSPIKKIKGSEREIIDPIEGIIKDTYAIINSAERNSVGVALANLSKQNFELGRLFEKVVAPMTVTKIKAKEVLDKITGLSLIDNPELADLFEEAGEQIVNIFRPTQDHGPNMLNVNMGDEHLVYQVEPDLFKAIQGLNAEDVGMIMRILSLPSKVLRAGATLSPDFTVRNPVRDQFSAFIYSKYGFLPGVDLVRGLFSVLGKDDAYQLWEMAGGQGSSLVSLDRDYLKKTFKEILRSKKATALHYLTHPIQLLQALSEFGEEATRLGEMKRGLAAGAKPPEAAFASREVTLDFARIGAKTKAVNAIIAFWNANVQGMDKMIRSFKEKPFRTLTKVFMGITLPSILLYFANRKDPRWKEIPGWQKDLFWIVLTKNHIYRIPKPFELGILFGSLPERILEFLDTHDKTLFDNLETSIANGASPGFIPTFMEPVIENITNYSFFLDRKIVPSGKETLPPEAQYGTYTSEIAKIIGKALNYSPSKIDNLIQGYSGGLGKYATAGIDKALEGTGIVQSPPPPAGSLEDTPVLKAFMIRPPTGQSSESVNDVYNAYAQAASDYSFVKKLVDEGQPERAQEYAKSHPDVIYNKLLTAVIKDFADINKARDQIRESKNIDPETKRDKIKQLDDLQLEIAQKMLEKIK